ncbi:MULTISPECIES: uroporphyrinogen-III C-methyltransferase [Pseudoalteromonas]|nr:MULTISPECIES: uroporphyrinogen-III C-methyltransferase [Pseudoalteromonas]
MMRIAITRPEGKGLQLSQLLEKDGIYNVHTPVLRIEPCELNAAQLAPLSDADIIVFISQDAVKQLAAQVDALPTNAQLFAVGEQTAKAVQDCFSRSAVAPVQQDSEGLLALAPLQNIDAKQVVLVKGQGGRTLLAKTFKQRGAILNICAVYQRVPEQSDSSSWLDLWRIEQIDGIVITSNAAIDAVFNCQQSEYVDWLKSCHFFLVSQRSASYLHDTYGVSKTHISVAKGPDDLAIYTSIVPHQHQQGSHMSEQEKQPEAAKPETVTHTPQPVFKQKVSKLAILALLVALTGGAATAGLIIHGQQISDKTYAALAQLRADNALLSEQLKQTQSQLASVQSVQQGQRGAIEQQLTMQSQTVEAQLQAALSQAKQQISGALSSEALYLQRMAQFKANAEQDFQGASAVLQRLYEVVQNEADNTAVLSAIATDIAMLQAQPKPAYEDIYLKLHGMLQQVDELALKTLHLPEPKETQNTELSSDLNDFQSNLKKTWQNLVDDFIKIRTREVAVIDPLLDSEQQQLLRAQLRSHLSQAQSALMDKQASIFFSALESAKQTLSKYYDTRDDGVQAVLEQIGQLQNMGLQFNTQVELSSSTALKEWLQ